MTVRDAFKELIAADVAGLCSADNELAEPGTYTPEGGVGVSAYGIMDREAIQREQDSDGEAHPGRALLYLSTAVVATPRINDTWTPADGQVWTVEEVRNPGYGFAELVVARVTSAEKSGANYRIDRGRS